MAKKAKVVSLAASRARRTSTAFVLKVTLREVRPPIWRRLQVAGDLTLRELHHVLQIAMGWDDCHLHEFRIGGERFGMPDPQEDLGGSPLDEVGYHLRVLFKKRARAEYLYDFGDDWAHELLVEDVVPLEKSAPKAVCLDGSRACPPEDCGGPHGYQELVEVVAKPSHERHGELKEWVGEHFAPEEFDFAQVNRDLRGAGTAAWRRKRERFYGS
jgi:hypothetical protein